MIKVNFKLFLDFSYLHVDKLEMFSQPCLPIELLSTQITNHRVFTVVVEHVCLQLRVLDEFLTTNLALMIATP